MTETFDPTKPYRTRDGREVTGLRRIDIDGWYWAGVIQSLVNERWWETWWDKEGSWLGIGGEQHGLDLVNIPDQQSDVSESDAAPEPVAWRVQDFAGSWILFHDKATAERECRDTGATMQPLYTTTKRPSDEQSPEPVAPDQHAGANAQGSTREKARRFLQNLKPSSGSSVAPLPPQAVDIDALRKLCEATSSYGGSNKPALTIIGQHGGWIYASPDVVLDLLDRLRAAEAAGKARIVELEAINTGMIRTDNVVSEDELRELFSIEEDDDLGDGPHGVCDGEWHVESAESRQWRFFLNPVAAEDHIANLTDERDAAMAMAEAASKTPAPEPEWRVSDEEMARIVPGAVASGEYGRSPSREARLALDLRDAHALLRSLPPPDVRAKTIEECAKVVEQVRLEISSGNGAWSECMRDMAVRIATRIRALASRTEGGR